MLTIRLSWLHSIFKQSKFPNHILLNKLLMFSFCFHHRSNLSNECVVFSVKAMKNSLAMSHEDSDEAMKKAIKSLPVSYQTLARKIKLHLPALTKYFYCKNSCGLIGPVQSGQMNSTQELSCICGSTKIVPKYSSAVPYFSYSSVIEKIKYMIPMIYNKLDFSMNIKDCLEDITDGDAYKRIAGPNRLVIILGFDGVQVGGQQGTTIWPVVGLIAELPKKLREELSFTIAVHSGSKPPNHKLLSPFCEELNRSITEPIKVTIEKDGSMMQIQLSLYFLCGIADTPARTKMLNIKGHTSKLGCSTCLVNTRSSVTTIISIADLPYRKDSSWRKIAADVENMNLDNKNDNNIILDHFEGIQGRNEFMSFDYINLPFCCPPELMHSGFLGITKNFVDYFMRDIQNFDKTIGRKVAEFQIPSSISRNLTKDFNRKLKSKDYESFIFYIFVLIEDDIPRNAMDFLQLYSLFLSK